MYVISRKFRRVTGIKTAYSLHAYPPTPLPFLVDSIFLEISIPARFYPRISRIGVDAALIYAPGVPHKQ